MMIENETDWNKIKKNCAGRNRDQPSNDSLGSDIKFAGNENKVKMYEPKQKRKLVRVFTVVAYVFSVSLAAIILSLFYMFIYSPGKSYSAKRSSGNEQGFSNMFNETIISMEDEEPRALPLS